MGLVRRFIRSVPGRVAGRLRQRGAGSEEDPEGSALGPDQPPRRGDSLPSKAVEQGPQSSAAEVIPVDLSGLAPMLEAGGGLRIVNHWATWCAGCMEELPELGRLEAALAERVRFFGLSWERFQPLGTSEEACASIAEVMAGHGLSWPTLMLTDEVAPKDFFEQLGMDCQTIPQTWLVNDQGEILERIETVLDAAGVDALIAAVDSLA